MQLGSSERAWSPAGRAQLCVLREGEREPRDWEAFLENQGRLLWRLAQAEPLVEREDLLDHVSSMITSILETREWAPEDDKGPWVGPPRRALPGPVARWGVELLGHGISREIPQALEHWQVESRSALEKPSPPSKAELAGWSADLDLEAFLSDRLLL